MTLPKTFKAAVFTAKDKPLEIQDKELKSPEKGQVLVKVLACGVCHSDANVGNGSLGDLFPRVPGHEVVGDVVAVGEGVTRLKVGDRVGGPWHGGHDNTCRECQRGLFNMCQNESVNGVSMDGGYGEYVTLRDEAVVRVPKDIDVAEVAPLLCAGVTVFNSIRKMNIEQGGIVAIQGLGGLGHLAVQYASKMGYRVVALSHGEDKHEFATQLGAHDFIDTTSHDAGDELQKLGGASLVVSTAPNSKALAPILHGLRPGGTLLVLALVDKLEIDAVFLVVKGISVRGWPSGHALDSEEAIAFAQLHGVKCMVEKFPLEKAAEAFDHMMSGKARFRAVLTMN